MPQFAISTVFVALFVCLWVENTQAKGLKYQPHVSQHQRQRFVEQAVERPKKHSERLQKHGKHAALEAQQPASTEAASTEPAKGDKAGENDKTNKVADGIKSGKRCVSKPKDDNDEQQQQQQQPQKKAEKAGANDEQQNSNEQQPTCPLNTTEDFVAAWYGKDSSRCATAIEAINELIDTAKMEKACTTDSNGNSMSHTQLEQFVTLFFFEDRRSVDINTKCVQQCTATKYSEDNDQCAKLECCMRGADSFPDAIFNREWHQATPNNKEASAECMECKASIDEFEEATRNVCWDKLDGLMDLMADECYEAINSKMKTSTGSNSVDTNQLCKKLFEDYTEESWQKENCQGLPKIEDRADEFCYDDFSFADQSARETWQQCKAVTREGNYVFFKDKAPSPSALERATRVAVNDLQQSLSKLLG